MPHSTSRTKKSTLRQTRRKSTVPKLPYMEADSARCRMSRTIAGVTYLGSKQLCSSSMIILSQWNIVIWSVTQASRTQQQDARSKTNDITRQWMNISSWRSLHQYPSKFTPKEKSEVKLSKTISYTLKQGKIYFDEASRTDSVWFLRPSNWVWVKFHANSKNKPFEY